MYRYLQTLLWTMSDCIALAGRQFLGWSNPVSQHLEYQVKRQAPLSLDQISLNIKIADPLSNLSIPFFFVSCYLLFFQSHLNANYVTDSCMLQSEDPRQHLTIVKANDVLCFGCFLGIFDWIAFEFSTENVSYHPPTHYLHNPSLKSRDWVLSHCQVCKSSFSVTYHFKWDGNVYTQCA